ncbi:hypothetical protein BPT24_073 [Tenacibaculum phage pT24]|uniref:Uncharacterized protein n=1 Tax=Tenacibaculum phage pT24 TaxID=1880590 RepID=A0A1B4XWK8_9CAUD|nr:hypothetical protein HYP10_gp073 [Tenacibaculum phage pT24]BAV39196.1 hypothetical protein BPT24_073 [Tenacibaculum phage pT24]
MGVFFKFINKEEEVNVETPVSERRINERELKDGRKFWRTHNGFKFWVEYKGEILEVDEAYYDRLVRLYKKKPKDD